MAAVNAGELFLEGGVVCLVWVWLWFLLKSLMSLYGGCVCETEKDSYLGKVQMGEIQEKSYKVKVSISLYLLIWKRVLQIGHSLKVYVVKKEVYVVNSGRLITRRTRVKVL